MGVEQDAVLEGSDLQQDERPEGDYHQEWMEAERWKTEMEEKEAAETKARSVPADRSGGSPKQASGGQREQVEQDAVLQGTELQQDERPEDDYLKDWMEAQRWKTEMEEKEAAETKQNKAETKQNKAE